MYLFLMGLFALSLLISLSQHDIDKIIMAITLMVFITLAKLGLAFKTLEREHQILKKRLRILEEKSAEALTQETTTEPTESIHTFDDEQTSAVDTATLHAEKRKVQKSKTAQSVSAKRTPTRPAPVADPMIRSIQWLKTYLSTGNPMVKAGSIILFFGLSFLIKFAFTNDMISMEMALTAVLAFAIGLIIIGFRFRKREGHFGLILQGLGIAIFYLAIFSGAKFFSIIPFGMALAVMIITVIFATFLAVIQDAFYLAVFATVGGFLAPILTSTGAGSHVVLFSYYSLLNISIVAIAWFKSWRLLNLIGFAFTFVIGTLWGVSQYTPEHFSTTEPFLIFFFLLYVGVAVLFAHRTRFQLKAYVDSTLVFGVPSVGFGLQAALTQGMEYALAYSALGVSALYLGLAAWLRKKEDFALLSESFLALGVVFLSLVFAFALSPEISSVIFALESSAIIWVSLRQDRLYARIFALALEAYAVLSFVEHTRYINSELFLNSIYLGFAILAIATLSSAFIYERYAELTKPFEQNFHKILLAVGMVIWVIAGFKEVDHQEFAYFSIYLSLSALGFLALSLRAQWQTLQQVLELYTPLILIIFTVALSNETHPFVNYNFIAFVLFIVTHYLILKKLTLFYAYYWHAVGLWVSLALLSWEGYYQLAKLSALSALSLLPLLSIITVLLLLKAPNIWPFSSHYKSYNPLAVQGIALALLVWEFIASSHSGSIAALIYIPLLNPLELMQASAFIVIIIWAKQTTLPRVYIYRAVAVGTILLLTLMLARSVHYYGDVDYTLFALKRSDIFQTALSILYTLIALGTIVYAKRHSARTLWIVGAILQGAVIAKLLLVDMSRSGSLERIISFLVVGLLILVIGFIAPLPPKQERS